jgi:hypothetical protein
VNYQRPSLCATSCGRTLSRTLGITTCEAARTSIRIKPFASFWNGTACCPSSVRTKSQLKTLGAFGFPSNVWLWLTRRRYRKTGFPSIMTLSSAPNYLDVYNNKAAIVKYEANIYSASDSSTICRTRTGCPISWTRSAGACHSSARRVRPFIFFSRNFLAIVDRGLVVTDMLAAVLNICTQEELMEGSDGSAGAPSRAPVDRDLAEWRKVIMKRAEGTDMTIIGSWLRPALGCQCTACSMMGRHDISYRYWP